MTSPDECTISEVLPLLVVQFRFKGKTGHSQNAVHGGSQFVADVRDEIGLGVGSLFRRIAIGLQCINLGAQSLDSRR